MTEWHYALGKMRAYVRHKSVYYSHMLLSFAPYPTQEIKTAGVTENLVLIFNPDFLLSLTKEQGAGLLVHEIHHGAGKHHKRIEVLIKPYEHIPNIRHIANIAADLAINPPVKKEGWELPPDGWFPKDIGFQEGLILEEYFRLLMRMPEDERASAMKPKSGQGNGQPQEGQGQGQKQQPQGDVGVGRCGGIAGNSLGDVEAKAMREVGRAASEVESIATKQARDIVQACKGRGDTAADLEEAVEVRAAPKLSYDRLLARYLQDSIASFERGFDIFSRRAISKKSFMTNVVRSGMIEGKPEVAVIFDTSGSMGKPQLSRCVTETVGVLRSCDIDAVWLIEADTEVARPPRRVGLRAVKDGLSMKGRGGTHFDAALKALEELRPRPNVAIYFTDGDGAGTYQPKGIAVIWVVVESRYQRAPDTTFGKVVMIPA